METLSQGKSSFAEKTKNKVKSFAKNILVAGVLSATSFSTMAADEHSNHVNILDQSTYEQSIEAYEQQKSVVIEDSSYLIIHTHNLNLSTLKNEIEKHGIDYSSLAEEVDSQQKGFQSLGQNPNKNYVDSLNFETNDGKQVVFHNTSTDELQNHFKSDFKSEKLQNTFYKYVVQHELSHIEDHKVVNGEHKYNFTNQHEIYADIKSIQTIFKTEDLSSNERQQILDYLIKMRRTDTVFATENNIRDNHTTHFALEALQSYYESHNYSEESIYNIKDSELYNFSMNLVDIDFSHQINQKLKDKIIQQKQDILYSPYDIANNPLASLPLQVQATSIRHQQETTGEMKLNNDYELTAENIHDILSEGINNGLYKVDLEFLKQELSGKKVSFFQIDKKDGKFEDSELIDIFKEATEKYYESKETFTLDDPEVSLLSFQDLSLRENISTELNSLFQNAYNQPQLSVDYENNLNNNNTKGRKLNN